MLARLAAATIAGFANWVAPKLSHQRCANALKLQFARTVPIHPNGEPKYEPNAHLRRERPVLPGGRYGARRCGRDLREEPGNQGICPAKIALPNQAKTS